MKQSSQLKRIIAWKRKEITAARRAAPVSQIREALVKAPPTRNFSDRITRRKPYEIHLIAELKKASPSAGVIRPKMDCALLAAELEKAGASALSVLTDAKFFQGSVENLVTARAACGLPVMRKDFILDEYQVYASRLMGADALLFIAGLHAQKKLVALVTLSRNLGLTPVVEVHSAAELRRVLDLGPGTIVGINTRDLATFKTDFTVAEELRPMIPAGYPVICESGIDGPRQIARLRELRFDAVLVGEALMRPRTPTRLVHELLYS